MKIVNVEKLSVTNSGSKTITFNGNKSGDTVVSEVYVQLTDDCVMTATGYVDGQENGIDLKMINMGTFTTVEATEDAGLYLILSGSLQKLQLDFTGTTDVVIKTVF